MIIPGDFLGDIRIVGFHQRKQLAGDIPDQTTMIIAGPYLAGVLLGRLLNGGGQSSREVGTIFMLIPWFTLQSVPGETRSWILSAFTRPLSQL